MLWSFFSIEVFSVWVDLRHVGIFGSCTTNYRYSYLARLCIVRGYFNKSMEPVSK